MFAFAPWGTHIRRKPSETVSWGKDALFRPRYGPHSPGGFGYKGRSACVKSPGRAFGLCTITTLPKEKQTSLAEIGRSGRRALAAMGRKARQEAEREPSQQEAPGEYAQERVARAAETTARETVYQGTRLAGFGAGKAANAVARKIFKRIPQQADPLDGQAARHRYRMKVIRGRQQAARTIKGGTKGIKAAGKGIKAGNQGIKTGVRAVRATAKTTARTARAAARASARLAPGARAAIRALIAAAKALAKAAAAAAKAAAAALKALIAWIAAGGWVVLLVILAVAVIVLVLGSALGVFFTDELNDGRLKQAILDTNAQFTANLQAQIDSLSAGGYDAVVVTYDGDYDGDGSMINNWQDVLAVFATKNMYEGKELLEFDDAKAAALSLVFNHMNQAQFHTRVETETTAATVDGQEVTQTTSTLYIHIAVESMTYLEGAALYRFDAEQREMLAQLMDKEYNQLWAELLDVDLYGGLTYREWTELPSRLPAGDTGSSIAAAALSKVGTAYSVMDCSQLTQYAYGQAGITLPRTSVEQAKYCYNNGYAISSGQLQLGDLIFWSKACTCGRWNEIHHTGIYIGDGRIVDASSSKGRVVLRSLWGENGSTWKIVLYARPHV